MSVLTRIMRKPFDFVEHKMQNIKGHIKDEISEVVTKIIVILALVALMLFTVLFASIALSMWLNVLLDSPVQGYLIVAGIYLLLFIIFFMVRKKDYLYRKSKQYADYFIKGLNF